MLPLPRRRAGRCCSTPAPRSSHVGGATGARRARCSARTCAATSASSPSTAARARPSARGALLLAGAAAARARLPRRARRASTGTPRDWLAIHARDAGCLSLLAASAAAASSRASCRTTGSGSACGSRRRRSACCCPGALIARALRLPRRRGRRSRWALGALFVALARRLRVHGSIWLALVVLRRGRRSPRSPFALRRGAPAAAARTRGLGRARASASLLGIAALARRARRSAATRSSTSPACGSWSSFGDLLLDGGRRVRRRRAAPGLRVPALARLPRARRAGSPGVDPAVVVLHEAALLVPLAFLVAFEAGRAVFGSAWGGLGRARRRRSRSSCSRAGHGGRVRLARAAGDRRRASCSCRRRSRSSSLLRPERRGRADSPRSRRRRLALALVHPTYALFLADPARRLRARAARLRATRRCAALAGALAPRGDPDRLACSLAAADRARTPPAHPTGAELARALALLRAS